MSTEEARQGCARFPPEALRLTTINLAFHARQNIFQKRRQRKDIFRQKKLTNNHKNNSGAISYSNRHYQTGSGKPFREHKMIPGGNSDLHKEIINTGHRNYADTYIFLIIQVYSSPPLSAGNMSRDPQWMPETTKSTRPYTSCFPQYVHTNDKV